MRMAIECSIHVFCAFFFILTECMARKENMWKAEERKNQIKRVKQNVGTNIFMLF